MRSVKLLCNVIQVFASVLYSFFGGKLIPAQTWLRLLVFMVKLLTHGYFWFFRTYLIINGYFCLCRGISGQICTIGVIFGHFWSLWTIILVISVILSRSSGQCCSEMLVINAAENNRLFLVDSSPLGQITRHFTVVNSLRGKKCIYISNIALST